MIVNFLRKNSDGTIEYYLSRVPDSGESATVQLLNESGASYLASQAATLGDRETISVAASIGDTTVTVTDASDFSVGERVVLLDVLGREELNIIDALSSTVITFRYPLIRDYTTSGVIVSPRVTVDVEAAEVSSARTNLRAVWTYVSDSATRIEESIVHITPWAPVCVVTSLDVLGRFPRANLSIASGQTLTDIISEVWKRDVLADLSLQLTPQALVSGESLSSATIERVLAQVASANEDWEEYDKRMEEYARYISQAVVEAPMDADGDGDIDDADEAVMPHPWVIRGLR